MNYDRTVRYGIVFLLIACALWGCPKKSDVTASSEPQSSETTTGPLQSNVTGTGRDDQRQAAEAADAGLRPVFFDYDKSLLRDDARRVLMNNAAWLKANPKSTVRIEGNCDERGTKEYNQALGQRRAESAKKLLTHLGISADRIVLLSYGKEKPVCTEGTEACWQKDRRDDFVVVNE